MTTFNFDMRRIGQTIARLRRERNMTQMALADEMGVSFQAVSNWERGQSMPDISKLPDMTELLPFLPTGKVDELLRQHTAEGKRLSDYAVFASTAAVDEVALGKLQAEESLAELLPFMSQKAIDDLARTRESSGQSTNFLLPFMSYAALNDITIARLKASKNIGDLLPFLNQDMLLKLFSAASTNH